MLGTDLCNELKKRYSVYGADIKESSLSALEGFYKCDILDADGLRKTAAEIKPFLIVHTAAWTNVDGCETDREKAFNVNVTGTKNVVNAAKAEGAGVVYISTDFVFDGKNRSPYAPEDNVNPLSYYALTKLEGERAVSALDKYFILRTSWLFGRNGINFVDTIIKKARAGEKLKVVNDQTGCPTYSKDLARAIAKMLEVMEADGKDGTRYRGVYHVSNTCPVTWFDYAKEILSFADIKGVQVMPITSAELARPAKRPEYSVLDVSKFEKLTNTKLRSWKEALKEYIDEK